MLLISHCLCHITHLTLHIQQVFVIVINAEEPNHQEGSYQESPSPPLPPDHQLL